MMEQQLNGVGSTLCFLTQKREANVRQAPLPNSPVCRDQSLDQRLYRTVMLRIEK